jgi:pimeloyl-ACP methyl ester carboxylesterase
LSQPTPNGSKAPLATLAALPPDGTWAVDLSTEELVAAGWPADVTPPGTYTWMFGQGRGRIELKDAAGIVVITCDATLAPSGDAVRFTYEGGACGQEVDTIHWTLDDDGLHFSLLSTNAPVDQQRAYLETKPWRSVDGAPRVTVPATVISGTFAANGRELFLECLGGGSPTVILEAGEGQTYMEMRGLQLALASEATVCSYDRANIGRSGSAPAPRTARDAVEDLHALLGTAAIPGPYVLVGHSAGGFLVQLYGRTYPADVAAVVAMNPVPPAGPWLDRALPLMTASERREENAYYDGQNDGSMDYRTSSAQLEQAPEPPDIPFEMLISTIAQCAHPTDICGKTYAVYEDVEREVAEAWPRGVFSQADAIHSIYIADLDAVVAVVRRAIDAGRATGGSRG